MGDDIDARPGSVVSLLRTFVGLSLRRLGGWIAAGDLVRAMGALDIEPAQTRTGVARLRSKGLLVSERRGVAGYRLAPAALPMLERGDRRIFTVREMPEGAPWCLISFSIAESRRDVRAQLRRRLQWIGAGTVAPGLWICPDALSAEAEQILDDLGVRENATLFRTGTPNVAGDLRDAIAQWWDLEELRRAHLAFLARVADDPLLGPLRDSVLGSPLGSPPASSDGGGPAEQSRRGLPSSAAAFAAYVRLVDSWRLLPYIDPGLPRTLLPDDWPGARSAEVFARLSEVLAEAAWEFLER